MPRTPRDFYRSLFGGGMVPSGDPWSYPPAGMELLGPTADPEPPTGGIRIGEYAGEPRYIYTGELPPYTGEPLDLADDTGGEPPGGQTGGQDVWDPVYGRLTRHPEIPGMAIDSLGRVFETVYEPGDRTKILGWKEVKLTDRQGPPQAITGTGIERQVDAYGGTTIYENGRVVGFQNKGDSTPTWTAPDFAAKIAAAGRSPQAWKDTREGVEFQAQADLLKAAAGRSPGTPQAWGNTEAGTRAGWAHEDAQEERKATQKSLADERAAQLAKDLKQIEANTELTKADKELKKQELVNASAKEINDALLEFKRWEANLTAEGKTRDLAAQKAIAEGNWALARDQLASSEKIAGARAQVEREMGALKLYGELLAVEATERSKRAASAASVFNTLATLAPRDQLRTAFYTLRGAAPPPSTITQIPPGLWNALGVNQDTASAAAQQLRGQVSVAPWLSGLMGGKLA